MDIITYALCKKYTNKRIEDLQALGPFIFKGSVATYDDLPTSGQHKGDVWTVEDTGDEYLWSGTAWIRFGANDNITGSGSVIPGAGTPSVTVTAETIEGHRNFDFEFSGIEGESGVYIGEEEPTGDQNVWIYDDGEASFPDGCLSLERLGTYLYKITFDTLPEYVPTNGGVSGGCTSFVRDGKLYRNLDWTYSKTADFIVKFHGVEGMAFNDSVKDESLRDSIAAIGQLPYRIVDGRNDDGLMVSTHVLYNDFGYEGSGDKNVDIRLLPYLILTTMSSVNTVSDEIENLIANAYIPAGMVSQNYLIQVLVTDGETTKLFTPTSNGYDYIDISENPKLTNFKWLDKAEVTRTDSDLQLHPTGIERWNMIGSSIKLEELKYTLCYESDARLSEFIGENGTSKNSTDAELEAVYAIAHNEYLTRTRDDPITWQTTHSVVYSKKGMESLYIQEDYDKNYISVASEGGQGGGSGVEIVTFNIEQDYDSDGWHVTSATHTPKQVYNLAMSGATVIAKTIYETDDFTYVPLFSLYRGSRVEFRNTAKTFRDYTTYAITGRFYDDDEGEWDYERENQRLDNPLYRHTIKVSSRDSSFVAYLELYGSTRYNSFNQYDLYDLLYEGGYTGSFVDGVNATGAISVNEEVKPIVRFYGTETRGEFGVWYLDGTTSYKTNVNARYYTCNSELIHGGN